jgi:hypothetical protein
MPTNTITLETAQTWAANWRKGQNNPVKGYLIPRIDIDQLIANVDTEDVRAYIGINERNQQTLMLVGVDIDGNDLIDDTKGFYIYDRINPCPNDCDTSSKLY